MVLTAEEGARIGLTDRQVQIVNMISERKNRSQIAEALGIGKQTARDLIGGLCDHYNCPVARLERSVREDLATAGAEIS